MIKIYLLTAYYVFVPTQGPAYPQTLTAQFKSSVDCMEFQYEFGKAKVDAGNRVINFVPISTCDSAYPVFGETITNDAEFKAALKRELAKKTGP